LSGQRDAAMCACADKQAPVESLKEPIKASEYPARFPRSALARPTALCWRPNDTGVKGSGIITAPAQTLMLGPHGRAQVSLENSAHGLGFEQSAFTTAWLQTHGRFDVIGGVALTTTLATVRVRYVSRGKYLNLEEARQSGAFSERVQPPAIAATMRNGCAPLTTASGSGVSGASSERSRWHAKKRKNGRRRWVA
jgi:hypothetical protein